MSYSTSRRRSSTSSASSSRRISVPSRPQSSSVSHRPPVTVVRAGSGYQRSFAVPRPGSAGARSFGGSVPARPNPAPRLVSPAMLSLAGKLPPPGSGVLDCGLGGGGGGEGGRALNREGQAMGDDAEAEDNYEQRRAHTARADCLPVTTKHSAESAAAVPPATGSAGSPSLSPARTPVFVWGRNESGQCGLNAGTSAELRHPAQVCVAEDFVAVAAGASHTLFLSKCGNVWSFGEHGRSLPQKQLHGANHRSSSSLAVASPSGAAGRGDLVISSQTPASLLRLGSAMRPKVPIKVVEVACGDAHSAVVTESGHLLCWGSSNAHGQLGRRQRQDDRTSVADGANALAAPPRLRSSPV